LFKDHSECDFKEGSFFTHKYQTRLKRIKT
jgi:hypothetical protein